ncbi:MAG TPA: carboxypeptidase-like regulatory domain-containing protein [Gemmataceae bacterium]|nr:carboxypeptidase-like regulatory domain-containing protein [Gemmataceae bacterium]
MIRLTGALVLLALVPLLAGCGRGWGKISGTVRYKGNPLPMGTITFYDEINGAEFSLIEDGKYEVSKVAAGKAKITVAAPMPIFLPGDKKGPQRLAKMPKDFPSRYADAEKSGLVRDVKSGSQTIDFDLD